MLSINTPAKVNLFLNIRGQRPDGYHELCMVMQAITLFDTLTVWPNLEASELVLTCDHPLLMTDNPADNLISKAYELFFRWTELPALGLTVHLEKRIPVQAGLGGGSSDAAAMLQILNQLTCAELSYEELRQMATHLGADVPFFLTGGTALARGRGELIEPLLSSPVLPMVVIKPRTFGIATVLAYNAYREQGHYEIKSPETLLNALNTFCMPAEVEPCLLNDFESVLFEQHPLLARWARQMQDLGIQRPLLSGSGPSLVGLIDDTSENRQILARYFPVADFEVFWVTTHPAGMVSVAPDSTFDVAAVCFERSG